MNKFDQLANEMRAAKARYGAFTSTHEALGVLIEEVEELKDAVRENSIESVRHEAIQVAAVAYRLALEEDPDFLARSVK